MLLQQSPTSWSTFAKTDCIIVLALERCIASFSSSRCVHSDEFAITMRYRAIIAAIVN